METRKIIYEGKEYDAMPMKHNKGKEAYAIQIRLDTVLPLTEDQRTRSKVLIAGQHEFSIV